MAFSVENQQRYIKPKGTAKNECRIRSWYVLGVLPNLYIHLVHTFTNVESAINLF